MRNFYETLGILPNAEDVVIAAAYRALASRYHPDRYAGDKSDANKKMSEINVAYATLSDSEKRAKYDKDVISQIRENIIHDDDAESAFSQALDDSEEKWSIAVKIFPDLIAMRAKLEKTSTNLAFTFVSYLLETKNFQYRENIAADLEEKYFQTYFGDNDSIIGFARELIEIGARDALRALNSYLEVVGSDVDPALIVEKIVEEYQIKKIRIKYWEDNEQYRKQDIDHEIIKELERDVVDHGYCDSALKLIIKRGFTYREDIDKKSSGFLGLNRVYKYTIFHDSKVVANSLDLSDLVPWVRNNLIN